MGKVTDLDARRREKEQASQDVGELVNFNDLEIMTCPQCEGFLIAVAVQTEEGTMPGAMCPQCTVEID